MRFTQSFDLAQDRELVERLTERKMGVLRQPHWRSNGATLYR